MPHAAATKPVRLLLALALAAALLGGAGPQLATAQAPSDELDPSEDNADPASRTACADIRSDAGSLVTRRLVNGPRRPDGSLAFVSGVCLYLPPGYDSGALRYPVLYLLHGAFGWQHDWVTQGGVQEVMDQAYAQDPANALIVAMPDGTYNARWADDPSGYPLNETYVFDHVIPYVDRHFRTIDDASGRAMSGLSNGGAGTLRLATKHPDRFAAVTAMSAALPVNMAAPTDVRAVSNDPTEMADNLDQLDLALIWGSQCGDAATCQTYGFAWAFEQACCNNDVYVARLEANGRTRPYTYVSTVGGHDWFFWNKWLREEHGPYLRERLRDPLPLAAAVPPAAAPERFRFRTIATEFDIYGYDVAVEGRSAREFLYLTDVTAAGLTLRGSGQATITTAPRYVLGAVYRVSGAGAAPSDVVADAAGRLTFTADLGPGHTAHQYSPEQLAAEVAAAGAYWTTRAITIAPASGQMTPPASVATPNV